MSHAAFELELRRLGAELAELREDQAYLMRALLSREDRRTGAALVPLLGELMGENEFTVAEMTAAALNDRSAVGQAVRELVADYCTDPGGLRALGRLLARLEGVCFDGCRLKSAGQVRGVQRWRVQVSGA